MASKIVFVLVLFVSSFLIVSTRESLAEDVVLKTESSAGAETCDTSSERCSFVRIPDDVDWFIPEQDGYLCDYKYIKKSDGKYAIILSEKGTASGKIMVATQEIINSPNYDGPYYHTLQASHTIPKCSEGISIYYLNENILVNKKYMVFAINTRGFIDRIFVNKVEFGTVKDVVLDSPPVLPLHREILLSSSGLGYFAHERFPGLQGINKKLYAVSFCNKRNFQ